MKPEYRKPIIHNIPQELKAIQQWVVWRAMLKHGKWTKPPFDAKTGAAASHSNPATWTDFETALKAYQEGGYDGIGIVLTRDLSLVGFDFDHCISGGEIAPEVKGFLNELKTYAEYSPTDGIRALAFGRKPGSRCKMTAKGYEIYETGRYLTITGQSVNGHARIEERQPEIDAVYRAIWPKEKTSTMKKRGFFSSVDMSDQELLEKAFRSSNGDRIQALYNGDTAGFSSQSEADQALCNHLAFWFGRDAGRMDCVFRSSGLMRDKWDRRAMGQSTYGELTIDKAIRDCAKVYEPPGRPQGEKLPQRRKNINMGSSTKKSVPGVPGVPDEENTYKYIDKGHAESGTPQENKGVPGVPGFETRKDGLFFVDYVKKDKKWIKKEEFVCSTLKILAQTRSENQKSWGLLLEWQDPDNHQHTWAAPKRALVGDGLEFFRELTDRGLRIAPGRKALNKLAEYLLSSTVDQRIMCTEKTGWHNGDVYVLPDRTIGGTPDYKVIFQSEDNAGNPYVASGTSAEWREYVSSPCHGNSRLILAISAAFGSILLNLTGDENGGVHIVGGSSTGKSTAITVAGSVFGGAEMKQTWNATINGLGATAIMFNDAVMILDELSQCEPKAAGETAYLLSNGIEKGRANRNGGMKARRRWRMMFLSNGEIDLSQHLQADGKKIKAGQSVRLLSIPADAGAGMGVFEDLNGHPNGAAFADALKANALKYYGTAGPAFIEKIAGRIDEVKRQIAELRSQFLIEHMPAGAESQVGRAAARFALIAIAGELATAYGITGWKRGEALVSAVKCFQDWQEFRGGVGNHEEQSFIEQIREHFERYGESRYAKIPDDGRIISDRAGFRESTMTAEDGKPGAHIYYVLPKVFDADICIGFDRRQAIAILERRGILEIGTDGKKSISKRLPGLGKTRCYHIRGERLFNES